MLKDVTEAKSEDVKELWLWEHFDGEDRKISNNQFHLKKHIEKEFKNEYNDKITYHTASKGVIFVDRGGTEIGVIKKVEVIS